MSPFLHRVPPRASDEVEPRSSPRAASSSRLRSGRVRAAAASGVLLAAALALSAAASGAPASRPAPEQAAKSSCERCHADVATQEAEKPHARAGITCVACHGGDASAETKEAAKAEGTGYKGALKGVALVTTCGDCHADVATMNPYGIPTDQLAQYRTSQHGKMLFEKGDDEVATCADCHGAHGILGPESSDSPVHATNVPATCGRCHSDEARMKPYGIDAGIPKDWHDSIHAHRLEAGDLSAPQCATCHGSHGAVPPGFASVAAVCGKCHVREKELFETSPHAALVEDGSFPGCEACHGNHDVQPAKVELLGNLCTLCHDDGSDAITRRDRIKGDLSKLDERLASGRAALKAAAAEGLALEDDQLLFDQAETALKQARVVQHGLDAAKLEEVTGEARADLDKLTGRIEDRRESRREKRLSLLPVVAFLLLMSLGSWVRYRRIHRRSAQRHHGRPAH